MANSFTVQTIEEGQRNLIVKLTGYLDTSNQTATAGNAITIANYNCGGTAPTPTAVRIDHIDYSITDQLEVQLIWDAASPVIFLPLAGRGRMGFTDYGGIQNNATSPTGNVNIATTGWASGIQIYSIILHCVKQGPAL